MRPMRVRVSDHALERYLERVGSTGRNALANQIRKHLLPHLDKGAPVVRGAVFVEIDIDVMAVVEPSLLGGWDVVTVRNREVEA